MVLLWLVLTAQTVTLSAAEIDLVSARAGTESPRSDDGEFLRRLMLDLVGAPPTLEETRAFLADPDPLKRAMRIDALVDSPRFAEVWAGRFADLLLGEFAPSLDPPLVEGAADRMRHRFAAWLREQIEEDRSFTGIARDLMGATGRTSENPAVAYRLSFFRGDSPALNAAEGMASHFLGIRLYCARCHDHPFDRWSTDDYYSMAAFATRFRARSRDEGRDAEGVVVETEEWGSGIPKGYARPPRFMLDGSRPNEGEPPAEAFARLVIERGSAQISRAAANRIWAWLVGRGVVDPPDDFSLRSKPAPAALLVVLSREFERQNRSIKFLVKAICASETYQRTCVDSREPRRGEFARAFIRPLSDAELRRSIEAATGHGVAQAAGVDARLYLRTGLGEAIRRGGVLRSILQGTGTIEDKVEAMFLAALSRKPSSSELARVRASLGGGGEEAFEDAYWAILNSTEFTVRH